MFAEGNLKHSFRPILLARRTQRHIQHLLQPQASQEGEQPHQGLFAKIGRAA